MNYHSSQGENALHLFMIHDSNMKLNACKNMVIQHETLTSARHRDDLVIQYIPISKQQ